MFLYVVTFLYILSFFVEYFKLFEKYIHVMAIFFFVAEFNIKKIYFLMHVLICIIFLMYLNSTKKKKDALLQRGKII